MVNILGSIQVYGVPSCGPWLIRAMRVLFWIYTAVTLIVAIVQYWYLFTGPRQLTIQSMTPSWVLPILPVMLCGTLASLIASSQPPVQRAPIIVAGVTLQGLGWMVSFLMYAIYLGRLMQYGLPAPNLRPGMFIAVGPPSFTGLALIGLSNSLPQTAYFATHPSAPEVLRIVALFMAIFLWTLAFWFFCITVISVLIGIRKMSFHLVWWAFVFPNVGFTIATIDIGTQLESQAILWVGSIMTILLVCMWIFVFVSHLRALLTRNMMMPGMDEDKGGF
ncbi:MAG: tellurite-resistance/dicarboxylate transporter family protein [Janthinobacterium lividum]